MRNGQRRYWIVLLLALMVVLDLFGCSGAPPDESRVTLVLGAYTTPREAYGSAIIPAFKTRWKESTGQEIAFQESYLGSGAQSRAIIGGFQADVAALSLEADVNRIAAAGLITDNWKSRPHGGMVSTSVVAFAVRKGNPKGIEDWHSLAQPGLQILTPDARTSGGAMWNICSMYGAALRGFVRGVPADNPEAALDFLRSVFRNVSTMDKGARESITNFERGVGDVAITYENEVLVGLKQDQDYDYVLPRSSILIENPAAVIDVYARERGTLEAAESFIEFLWTPAAQRAYAEHGLRPVDEEVAAEFQSLYPPLEDLWTIDYLGGWEKVVPEFFGSDGLYVRMYREMHVR